MKNVVKELLKIVLVFVLCFIIIYFPLTIKDFFSWCDTIGVKPFRGWGETGEEINVEAINRYGEEISKTIENMEEAANVYYEEHPGETSTLDFFSSIGFVIVSDLQRNINHIVSTYIRISVFLSIAITIGYIITTKRNISNMLKFVLGYVVVFVIVPPIYMYSTTNRFWSFKEMYLGGIPKAFYIAYTIVFVVMFAVNFKVNSKLTDELNEMLKNKEYTKKGIRKKIVITIAITIIIVLIATFVRFIVINYQNYNIFKASINKVRNIQRNGNYYYEVSSSDYFGYLEGKMWVNGNKVKLILSLTDTNQIKYYNQAKNKVQIDEDNSKLHTETYYIDFDKNETYCVDEENKTYQVKNEIVLKKLKLLKYSKTYRVLTEKEDITFFDFISNLENWYKSNGWSYNPDTKEEKTTCSYIINYRDVSYQIDEQIHLNKENLLPECHYSGYDNSSIYNLVSNCVKDEDVTFNNINEYTMIEEDGKLFELLR